MSKYKPMEHWTETNRGWVTEMSTLTCPGQDVMPKGESYKDALTFRNRWSTHKSDGEIVSWTYMYPDGKTAVIMND